MLKIFKTKDVKTPVREGLNAGFDFFVPKSHRTIFLNPNESIAIESGIKVNIPKDHVLIAFNKSGIAIKNNLQIGACVIDENYQGEICLHVTNIGQEAQCIKGNMKLVQFVLLPIKYHEVEEGKDEGSMYQDWSENKKLERGDQGFGSTNRK